MTSTPTNTKSARIVWQKTNLHALKVMHESYSIVAFGHGEMALKETNSKCQTTVLVVN